MFVTGDQILLHLIGDYLLQSHWMATEKTKRSLAALVHAIVYTLPFLFLTRSPTVIAVIAGTHFVIDRWRLARYVVWLKNWIALPTWEPVEGSYDGYSYDERAVWPNLPWAECSKTGYPDEVPAWLSVWLLIIADNTLHLLCNAAVLRWL